MNPIRHRGRRLAVSAIYDGAFKMLVDTSLAGSASDTFVLPCSPSGLGPRYNFTLSWGDGPMTRHEGFNVGDITHVYPVSGRYVVSIHEVVHGGFPAIYFFNGGDKLKVLAILQWGTNTWLRMQSAFFGCENMVIRATDWQMARMSKVTDWWNAFRSTGITSFPRFDTRLATDVRGAWQQCSALATFPALDLSGCTSVEAAWYQCPFKEFPKIDFPACTNFKAAWYQCTGLTSFPMIDTGAGQNFENAWNGDTGLNGYDFPTLDMHSITNGVSMLRLANITKASYNSMLDQLANGRGSIPAAAANSVTFRCDAHYDSSTGGYDGTAARSYLTGTKTWTITDGGTP